MQAKAYMCFVSECRTNRRHQLTVPHCLSTRNAISCIARCTMDPILYIRVKPRVIIPVKAKGTFDSTLSFGRQAL